jgi:hypothetical protein
MSRINIGRVLIGGVVAGIVANALDYVWATYLMVDESADMASRLNLNNATVQASVTTWIVVDLLWGLLLVFNYAAIRPRFGPGPKTAAISAVILWLTVTIMFGGLCAMGIFTLPAYLKNSVLYLVSSLAASLAGAALYKEET